MSNSTDQLLQEFTRVATGREPAELAGLAMGEVYASFFWRPRLGLLPFALWQVLRDLQPEAEAAGRWPTISVIAKTMGATRAAILGRAATGRDPAQSGALDHLVGECLVVYQLIGAGNGQRYWFDVRPVLPILTPRQVQELDSVLARRHRRLLDSLGVLARWQAITAPTLARPFGERGW
ncbi:MAG: hypothetical protein L0332_34510 [Chloroflexi bacterium]|nr:hypothetical protein [Chloroflexota bacterium]